MKKIVKSLTAAALAFGLMTSVNTGLAGVTVNAAETTAQTSQAASTTGAVTVDGSYMYNDYIKMYVNSSDGKFVLGTTGGDPSTASDDNKTLIYGFPSNTWSSYATIVIDDTVYKYGETSFSTAPKYNTSDKSNTSMIKYGKINVTQKLSFIKNVSTGREDVLEIKYTVKNTDTAAHNIGTRIMIDTMLGSNDSAPFRVAGVGNVTTETEFTGDNIPQYWQAFDNLTNPTVVSQGTFLRYGDTNKPDKVQFANWSRVKGTAWNYEVREGSSNGDSAVTVTWNSKSLAAGQTRTFITYYGLSELTQDLLPPLAVSVYGDNTVTYTSVDATTGLPQYSTLAVTAYVQNIGSGDATNATAKIELPSNFSLANGSQKISLGTVKVGESKQATWNVKVAGNTPAGSYPIKIVCDSAETDAKTVERSVTVPSVIVNNSKLSENTIVIGDKVTVTAAAKGGSGSYTYAVYYKKNTDTNWVTSQDFSTNKTVSIKPSKATKYQVLVKVKDANGTVSEKTLNLTVNNPLANTSKISAASINQGETVKATGAATGGVAPYTYAFYYKRAASTGWSTVKDFSAASTADIKPASSGDYQICVKVKDSKGTVEKKYFDVNVKASALKNTSTISSTNIVIGTTVDVKAAATGGSGSYTYAVLYRRADTSKWTVKQNYNTNSTVRIKPETATKYEVCVKVKDSTGKIEKKYLTFTVKSSLVNHSTLSATSVASGGTVTVNAVAEGGSGSYTYAVLYRRAGTSKWTVKQDFKTNNKVSIKPAAATNYEVCVKVKDSTGIIVKKYLTFSVKSALKNTSTLSAASIVYGNTVTVNASATGGSGSYTYAVYYRRAGTSKWTEKQAFKTNAKVSVKPAAATNYEVCIKVKDSSGAIVKKYL